MNIRWLLIILLTSWVATCGQKGPLELPESSTVVNPVMPTGQAQG